MKKTVTVNISGIFFHIDEDAYEILNRYIDSLKYHFQNNSGKDEIISDIESRIAEILQSKVNDKKHVIEIEDIQEIISILGKPEDFNGDESEPQKPNNQESTYRNKRLYRDADNRVLGGVASGISHYFNVDPIWIRLAFVATFYIFGPLVYIIVWIIVPQARSTAEKLEMKGERVNISNIENSIKEEFAHVKNKVNDFANDTKDYYKNRNYKSKGEKTMYRSLDFIENIFKYGVKAIVVFAGIILIGIGIALAAGLISSMSSNNNLLIFNNGTHGLSLAHFLSLFLESTQLINLAIIGIMLLIGIPVIMIVYGGVKMVLGIHQRYKAISLSALSLWLAGLFITLYCLFSGLSSYQEKGFTKQIYPISDSINNKLIVKIQASELSDNINGLIDEEDEDINLNLHNFIMSVKNGTNINYGYPEINFKASTENKYEVVATKIARGANIKDAKENSEKINFNVNATDSVLMIDKFFTTSNPKWRKQQVKITIKIPVGKQIYLDQSLEGIKYYSTFESNLYEIDKYNTWYVMTENGLKEETTK